VDIGFSGARSSPPNGFLNRLIGGKPDRAPALKLACLVHAGGMLGIVGESCLARAAHSPAFTVSVYVHLLSDDLPDADLFGPAP
jgi:hypothetical protein